MTRRVAFPMIGGRDWMGGYNYLLNLVTVLAEHGKAAVSPIVIFGDDVEEAEVAPFAAVPGVEAVRDPGFSAPRRNARLARALATGVDEVALAAFRRVGADLAFEPAQYFGWRLPLPILAWMPDFQHRRLKGAFGPAAWWRREIGCQAQVVSGRSVLLSSQDARRDCERFYPLSRGRTHVARFAVAPHAVAEAEVAAARARHGLPDHYIYLPNQVWTHKNHETAIRACALARRQGRAVVVAATGRAHDPRAPGHFERLQALVRTEGAEADFRFLGLVPYTDVRLLAAGAAAILNPSLFEGWSTTVEEARAMGAPLILSDIPVHREQADAWGRFFAPKDAAALAALMAATPARDAARRAADRAAAAQAAPARLAGFAASFAAAVEAAARRSGT